MVEIHRPAPQIELSTVGRTREQSPRAKERRPSDTKWPLNMRQSLAADGVGSRGRSQALGPGGEAAR